LNQLLKLVGKDNFLLGYNLNKKKVGIIKMNDSKTFNIEQIDSDNFSVIILEKIKVDVTRDELLQLFWNLADRLEYDTRSKW